MNRQEQVEYLKALGLNPEDFGESETKVDDVRKTYLHMCRQKGMLPDQEVMKTLHHGLFDVADKAKIKKAFNKLALLHHPDQGGDPEEFKKIFEAYKMLTDPSFRHEQKEKKPQTNLDTVINMKINFSQAFFGTSFTVSMSPLHLDSRGKTYPIDVEKEVHVEVAAVKIIIPAGISNGERLTIKGAGSRQGDRKGDLICLIEVVPDPQYRMQGLDIEEDFNIELEKMLSGCELEVETMWGLKTVKIPPGCKADDKIEIKGAGVAKQGNHVLVLKAVFPEKDELKKNTFWKKLDIKWEDPEKEPETNWEELYERLRWAPPKSEDFSAF